MSLTLVALIARVSMIRVQPFGLYSDRVQYLTRHTEIGIG